jgi:hypothetical protein
MNYFLIFSNVMKNNLLIFVFKFIKRMVSKNLTDKKIKG